MNYDAWADWYDVFYSSVGVDDVEFYVELAQASGGPVLEIGCGTGRVSLPIAAAGIDVVGVDFATAMLEKAREQATKTKGHGGAVEFVQGDMRTLALDRHFPLVIIPARTLYLALTPEEQLETLRRAAEHLAPTGALAFNLFVPDSDLISDVSEKPFSMGETIHPETGLRCLLTAVNRTDPVGQTIHSIQTVEELSDTGEVVRTVNLEVDLRYLYPSEVHVMLEQVGMVADQVFGDFDGGPLTEDSEEMVWVVRAAAP